jgi:hypothetical protein
MRIRILRKPHAECIDGVQLDVFVPGQQYEVGSMVGAVMLCEGWAEPVDNPARALMVPLDELTHDAPASHLPNLKREYHPPYYDGPPLAEDRRLRKRYPAKRG